MDSVTSSDVAESLTRGGNIFTRNSVMSGSADTLVDMKNDGTVIILFKCDAWLILKHIELFVNVPNNSNLEKEVILFRSNHFYFVFF